MRRRGGVQCCTTTEKRLQWVLGCLTVWRTIRPFTQSLTRKTEESYTLEAIPRQTQLAKTIALNASSSGFRIAHKFLPFGQTRATHPKFAYPDGVLSSS